MNFVEKALRMMNKGYAAIIIQNSAGSGRAKEYTKRKSSNNLKDTNQAKEQYEDLIQLVRFGKSKLRIFTDKEYYEGTIDPKNGSD
jgi:hypothetical protein